MEPRQSEKSLESRSQVQTSPTRQPDRKRRFRIVKLEERIAPGSPGPAGYKTAFCSIGYQCGHSNGHWCKF